MVPQALREVAAELPWRLRQDVTGYVESVSYAGREISAEIGVEMSDELNEQFLFLVGVRRIWAVVNGSYWLLDNSLSLGERAQVSAYLVGGSYQTRGGDFMRRLGRLRTDLEAFLGEHGLLDLMETSSPRDLLQMLVALGEA